VPFEQIALVRCLTLHVALQGGGLRVNNSKVDDEGYVMSEDDLIDGRLVLLSCGKKNKLLLRVE